MAVQTQMGQEGVKDPMLSPGTRIGPYDITSHLGAGGMGEVFRARDTRLGREVAIKVLPKSFADDPDRVRRFEQEARATAALSHPNILAVYDVGTCEGQPYLVTELLEGETLRARIKAQDLTVRRALEIAIHVAEGLAAAHEKGIVHRDLKPENLFVTAAGVVKVLDFGLAKLVEPEMLGEAVTEVQAAKTVSGLVLGTVGYMAPEQIRAQPVDARSDIFALGCILYEMLGQRQAFSGATATDTMSAILHQEPPPLTSCRAGLPPSLDGIVRRCLEKRPEERFRSAADLAFDLREQLSWPGRAPAEAIRTVGEHPSIVVLPFANVSADAEQEYFCDGMAEEIISALAHVEGLRVVARTSAFAFKGMAADIREIGGKLDVRTVLEGSVRRVGDQLRISAQLIDVSDGCHRWSERYDRRLEDVFAIQDEIALAIVENLKVKLLGAEKASVVRRNTENVEAHNAYLMGLFEWNKMTPEGFARAQELYREATHLDPNFAPAYSRLADALASMTWWADQPPVEALARALPLVERALALDPDLAHAFSVSGTCKAFLQRDWVGGEDGLRRAVELAPNDATTQVYLALLLVIKGCPEEGAARARLAQRLDPLSPAINAWAGSFLVCAGFTSEALATLQEQVARTPHLWMPRYFLSHALAVDGRLEEARPVAEKALELSGGLSLALSHLACLYYLLGQREAGDAPFERLRRRADAGYVAPTLLAWVHIARGESDAALVRVKEALAASDPWVTAHRLYSPAIIPPEPRVDALIDRILL